MFRDNAWLREKMKGGSTCSKNIYFNKHKKVKPGRNLNNPDTCNYKTKTRAHVTVIRDTTQDKEPGQTQGFKYGLTWVTRGRS